MNTQIKVKPRSLYEIDYQDWLHQTLVQLRSGDFVNLDLENLIEELASLGRSDKREISSYLMRLCEHLLKLKYWQSDQAICRRGWQLEIRNFRIQIQEQLEVSPSLQTFLQEIFSKQYKNGRKLFLDVSGLDPDLIPEQPCFTISQALDQDWLPNNSFFLSQ